MNVNTTDSYHNTPEALGGSKITRYDWSLLLPKECARLLLSLKPCAQRYSQTSGVIYVRDNYGVDVVMVTGGSSTEANF